MHFQGHSWQLPHAPPILSPDFGLIDVRGGLLYVIKSRRLLIYVNFATLFPQEDFVGRNQETECAPIVWFRKTSSIGNHITYP